MKRIAWILILVLIIVGVETIASDSDKETQSLMPGFFICFWFFGVIAFYYMDQLREPRWPAIIRKLKERHTSRRSNFLINVCGGFVLGVSFFLACIGAFAISLR